MQKYIPVVVMIVALGTLVCWARYAHSWTLIRTPFAETVLQRQPIASTTAEALHIPILIYHSVRPDLPIETHAQEEFSVTPEMFEQQLAYLKDHGYATITLDEMTREIQSGTTSPIVHPVVLTFDDGWQNQYVYAFPLLKKYGDTATFYIYTNPIGRYPQFLTWDEIKEMDAAGMTIGDHTRSHPYLSHLTPEQLRNEVLGGEKAIEDRLGKPVRHFASPFGYTSDALVALLRQEGFTTGRTTYRGAHHTTGDLLRLTGFLVHRDMHDFVWALQYSP